MVRVGVTLEQLVLFPAPQVRNICRNNSELARKDLGSTRSTSRSYGQLVHRVVCLLSSKRFLQQRLEIMEALCQQVPTIIRWVNETSERWRRSEKSIEPLHSTLGL